MTYYAINDLQTGGLLATGRNETSKEVVHQALLSYISSDLDEVEEQADPMSLDYILEAWEFELLEQDKPFPKWEDE